MDERFASAVFWVTLSVALLSEPLAGQCVDYSKDPAGCQPSTFDTPIGQVPSVRVNRAGKLDPTSAEIASSWVTATARAAPPHPCRPRR